MFKNKLNLLIYFILTFTFFINFFIINQFSSLGIVAFISNDEIYLIEQLLLKIKKSYIAFNADSAEYGIEFFYLAKIIIFFDIFFDFKEITIYKIISTFHLTCFILSNFVVIKIFQLIKINAKFSLLFVFCNSFNIFFIQSFFSLKPDFNIVFFLITLSFYFLIKFNKNNKIFFLNSSIFCASIAFCIKIWGFIMLIPIIYHLIKDKKKDYIPFLFKNFLFFSILLFLYLFYLLNSFEDFFISSPEYNFLFQNINIFKNFSFYDFILMINNYIFIVVLVYTLLFFFLFKAKIIDRKINLSLDIFFKFMIFVLILSIPTMLEFEKFIKSVFFFSKSFIFTQNLENSFYLNFLKIIENFYNLNYIYLISYIIIFSFYINFYFKKKIIISNEYKAFFFASVQIFLFYFFYKKFNIGSNIAVSLILITLIIFVDNNNVFFKNKNKYYIINAVLILLIIFPFKDNFYKYYYNQILTFKTIDNLQEDINLYLNEKNRQRHEVLICRKNLSFLKYDKIKILSHEECKQISKLPYKKNKLLILRTDQIRDHYNQEIENLILKNNAYLLKIFNYSFNWSNYIYKERINIYELKYES